MRATRWCVFGGAWCLTAAAVSFGCSDDGARRLMGTGGSSVAASGGGGSSSSASAGGGGSSSNGSGGGDGGGNTADCADGERTITDGGALVLCGSQFGDRPTAAPILYDDFEDGRAADPLLHWQSYGNAAVPPVYGEQRAFAGSLAAFIDLPVGTYSNGAYLGGLGLTEIYLSYRVFVVDGGGTPADGPQVKFARVTSGSTDIVHGTPSIGMTVLGHPASGSAIWYNYGSEDDGTFYGHTPPVGEWVRIEHYLKLSQPAGEPNGKRWSMVNQRGGMTSSAFPGHFADPNDVGVGEDTYAGANIVTMGAHAEGDRLNNVVLPFFTRSEQSVSLWVDEVYIDDTQARVELGDAPQWHDCTQRSPQPVTTWTDDAITVRVNRGQMSGTAYAFVVLADGAIEALGAVGVWP